MRSSHTSTLLILAAVLLVGIHSCAYAYIDPGTASAIWVAGLAPILAFLGFVGRKLVRMLIRSKPEGAGESGDDDATEVED